MLRAYETLDDTGKVNHQSWLTKVGTMYTDAPSMKNSLLHALLEFTLSRYKGDVTAPASPKLIGFFQTLHELNPSIFFVYSAKTLEVITKELSNVWQFANLLRPQ